MYISVYTRAPHFDNKCCYNTQTDFTFFINVGNKNAILGLPIIRTSSKVLITTLNKTDF